MRITNCTWELENLDCRVAEVRVDSCADCDTEKLCELEQQFDYIVVKAEAKDLPLYALLQQAGYQLAETQFAIQKNIRKFDIENDKLLQYHWRYFRAEKIVSVEDLEASLSQMTPMMYKTDRICLDPLFGAEYGLRRYQNWTRTEFARGADCLRMMYRDKEAGLALMKLTDDTVHCLLAGFYEAYQNMGLGILIPLLPLLYKETERWLYKTDISSNNMAVLQNYVYCQYNFTGCRYVFVKHTRNALTDNILPPPYLADNQHVIAVLVLVFRSVKSDAPIVVCDEKVSCIAAKYLMAA